MKRLSGNKRIGFYGYVREIITQNIFMWLLNKGRSRNRITGLEDQRGGWVEEEKEIQ